MAPPSKKLKKMPEAVKRHRGRPHKRENWKKAKKLGTKNDGVQCNDGSRLPYVAVARGGDKAIPNSIFKWPDKEKVRIDKLITHNCVVVSYCSLLNA
jgi:hypothetical protein